jgi:YidC/Oxa1 family membrane protein insertase
MLVFLGLSLIILVGNSMFQKWWLERNKPPVDPNAPKQLAEIKTAKELGQLALRSSSAAIALTSKLPVTPAVEVLVDEKDIDAAWYTLGAITDQEATSEKPVPRMLVTLNNEGATIERIELNRYPDLEDQIAFGAPKEDLLWNRAGYLGNLAPVKVEKGVKIQVVPPGTPAQVAGLRPGDVIFGLFNTKTEKDDEIKNPLQLFQALGRCEPETDVILKVLRDGGEESLKLTAKLGWRPAQVIRPEKYSHPVPYVGPRLPAADPKLPPIESHDPFSLAVQMVKIDDKERDDLKSPELESAQLKTKRWTGKQVNENTVEFTRELPAYNLRLTKRYELLSMNDKEHQTGYEVRFSIKIENTGDKERKVAYELGGPNGLPIEGWWYAYKNRISTSWFQALGIRDSAMRFEGRDSELFGTIDMVKGGTANVAPGESIPLVYAGVDCQYFAAVLIPQREKDQSPWLDRIAPEIVGSKPTEVALQKLTNVSCSLTSKEIDLPAGGSMKHTYDLFVGPKKPELLDQTGSDNTKLDRLVYFGWWIFSIPAHILLIVLHAYHWLIPNYGLNIIMLTITVRMMLYPLSKKQAISSEKMKQLQPQIAAIKEKYKGKGQEASLKTQELFRKHNFNPFGGCLVAFVQLPIFMGLYRALMIDVELRAAPLFGKGVDWCSNLGAPDMLWFWEPYLPAFLASPTGYLGPFLNVLPLITVTLFLKQQKSMMPPATDDQTRMQQSMMKYMTLFMGIMFYTVASGLCLYFIVSSLWGMMERKFLKKMASTMPTQPENPSPSSSSTASNYKANGSSGGRNKKQKGRRP